MLRVVDLGDRGKKAVSAEVVPAGNKTGAGGKKDHEGNLLSAMGWFMDGRSDVDVHVEHVIESRPLPPFSYFLLLEIFSSQRNSRCMPLPATPPTNEARPISRSQTRKQRHHARILPHCEVVHTSIIRIIHIIRHRVLPGAFRATVPVLQDC